MFKYVLAVSFFSIALPVVAEVAGSEVRDPTTPLTAIVNRAGTDHPHTLELNSVLISTQRKLVIINGNSLREGQIIPESADIKVLRILPQKVILAQKGREWAIMLSPSVVKKSR